MRHAIRFLLLAVVPLIAAPAPAQEMKPIPPVKPIPKVKPIPPMKDPMAHGDSGPTRSQAPSSPRHGNPVDQKNSCNSTDRCVAPPGGSCECHCEGTRSVCTIDYGPNGPPAQ